MILILGFIDLQTQQTPNPLAHEPSCFPFLDEHSSLKYNQNYDLKVLSKLASLKGLVIV